MISLSRIRDWATSVAESRNGKLVLKVLRVAVVGGIVAYLIYQLTQIGWATFWESLPSTPYFYITIALMYVTLPFAEVLIYTWLWNLSAGECLSLVMRKRVLNADVVGYSGEIYLLAEAKKKIDRPTRDIAAEIKDNLILSSIASIATACSLLGGLLASGYVVLDEILGNATPAYVGLGGFGFVLAIIVFVRFRQAIFSLAGSTLQYVLSIHLGRFFVNNALQVVQWWVVLPDAPFSAWATLLVILVALNRIPFIPSRDLAFAGVGISTAGSLGVPVPAVAGMLLTRSIIDRALNVGLFTILSIREANPLSTDLDGEEVSLFGASKEDDATAQKDDKDGSENAAPELASNAQLSAESDNQEEKHIPSS